MERVRSKISMSGKWENEDLPVCSVSMQRNSIPHVILYFDRRMSELVDYDETIMIVMRGVEFLRIDTEHAGKSSLSHFPDMDIFDFTLSISFYLLCDFFYDLSICGSIYEDSRCISHEKVCPSEYEDSTEYSHKRIKPVPAKILCSEKCQYRKN